MMCSGTSGVALSSRAARMRRPARAKTAGRRGVPGGGCAQEVARECGQERARRDGAREAEEGGAGASVRCPNG